jgi:hypothetical protein
MASGRKPNLDKKIHELIGQLKAALVARARLRIEAQVDARVATLVEGLQKVVEGGRAGREAKMATRAVGARLAKKRRGWSPAARAAAKKRMQAYWKAKKAQSRK